VDGIIEHDAPEWPYLQVAARLRNLVAGMAPGQRLPSIRALCQEHGVSWKTAQKAVKVLEDEDLVYTVASRGTFVKPH
jgi:GntR family transcriptional regulator